MATKIVMEALSPTMEEGRLVKWVQNEGTAVHNGDVLAEVETDKAVMELVARGEGTLRKQIVKAGETAPVGTLLGVIAAPDENIDAIVASAGAPPAAPAAPNSQPEAPAQASGSAQSGSSGSTHMSSIPGSAAMSQGEASTPPQEHDRRGHQRINTAPVGAAPNNGAAQRSSVTNGLVNTGPLPEGRLRSSPLARRLASELGIELDAVNGSGPGGRIIKRDIEQVKEQSTVPRGASLPAREDDYQDVALTQIRKTIAKRLAESIGPVPTFYLTAEYDVTRMAELRTAMAELGTAYKVSFNDILIKAVATALWQHPEVNAHWRGDAIRQFNRVHLGVAVAIEDGLITPVIFDADMKGLASIAAETKDLANRARARKLTPEEYTGSTFSISNLGMYGIDQFTAIINPPEAAILAVGAAEDKPVVVDGAVVVRKRLRVTMSCDHRVVDGAIGARFLETLRHMIENPLLLVY